MLTMSYANLVTKSYPQNWIATWDFGVMVLNVRILLICKQVCYIKTNLRARCLTSRQLFWDSVWISSKKSNPPPGSSMRHLRLPVPEALCWNVPHHYFLFPLSHSALLHHGTLFWKIQYDIFFRLLDRITSVYKKDTVL